MQIMIWVLHLKSLHLKNLESLILYESGKYSVGCHVARISSGITSEIDVSTMLLTIIYLSNKMRVGLRPKICLNSLQLKQVTDIQPFFFINLQTQSWIFSFGQIIDLTRLKFQFSWSDCCCNVMLFVGLYFERQYEKQRVHIVR